MAGRNVAGSLQGVDTSGVVTLGVVDDLGPLFDGARVFIAPTRCAAGSVKVQTAAAAGVPVVTTS